MWLRPRKTWQNPTHPVRLVINKDRGKNVTVYGAIGSCLPGAFFKQAETTNQTSTEDFINQLRAFSKIPLTEPIHLILDNHRAHHTLAVKQTMADN
jgi:transposase